MRQRDQNIARTPLKNKQIDDCSVKHTKLKKASYNNNNDKCQMYLT